mmetsp:Transcript_36467/g.79723  ORF Transcript_36467/g.79723 Transcript_36467/m.79723 type:complete len:330 (-) Transcript_36467:111-1100(-)
MSTSGEQGGGSGTARRRGKQQRSPATATTPSSTTTEDVAAAAAATAPRATTSSGSPATTTTVNEADMDATLQDAIQRIAVTNTRTADLHEMWRSSLLKLSYLVVVLCIHQTNGIIGQCVRDVKVVNDNIEVLSGGDDGEAVESISGIEASKLILIHALPVLLGIVIAGLLVKFLSIRDANTGTVADFGSPWYYVSAGMVPMIISLHFQSTGAGAGGGGGIIGSGGDDMETAVSSCVSTHAVASQYFDPGTLVDIASRTKTQLSVAVVWHTIVTVSYWFMKKGREQCDRNMEHLNKLGRQMEELKKRNKELKEEHKAVAQSKKKKSGKKK